MKLVWILFCSLLIWGCSDSSGGEGKNGKNETSGKDQSEKPVDPKDLVEIVGSTYTEYYDAAKTKVKFQGEQDENKERHGKWVYYREDGKELNITFYKHGIQHGFIQVKRPNGTLHYTGEFEEGQKVGVWKFYDEKGKVTNEINYDKK